MTDQSEHKKPKFIFVFPGQGSQSVGMGKFLFDNFNQAKILFEEASDAISIDVKKLCFESDEKTLALTENTQPALLTVSSATATILQNQFGISAHLTAGHSIGEYSSFVLGHSLKFTDAIKSVRQRGLAMQSAVPVGLGGMTAALGLNANQAQFLCQWATKNSKQGEISPANYNCEGQIVLSGYLKTLDWLKEHFTEQVLIDHDLGPASRIKFIPLQVSAPFHCQMMRPAEDKMREFFKNIHFEDSKISILQNLNAETSTEKNILKENLIKQISSPVLWTQSMINLKKMNSIGSEINVIECGHGQILKGLFKKTDPDFFKVHSTSTLEDLKKIETLLTL